MPGYLTEKLGLTETTLDLDPAHWRMLRLAKLRGLQVKRLSENYYAVSSHSRPGRWHGVRLNNGTCDCEAVGWCSNLSLAFDRRALDTPSTSAYLAYTNAQRADFNEMQLRFIRREETREDRLYARPAFLRVKARYEGEGQNTIEKEYACDF